MKKRILLPLLFSMIFCLFLTPPVSAGEPDNQVILTLEAMDLFDADQLTDASGASTITRGEFAALLAAGSQYQDTLDNTSSISPFRDVKYNHPYAAAIKTAVDAGWMLGYLDGSFRPDQSMKLEEAATAVLRLLGYTAEDMQGSYPTAQLAKYNALGLAEGINTRKGETLTTANAWQLVYNMMKAKTKTGTVYASSLGYSVNSAGEIDYAALIAKKMQGPFVLDNTDFSNLIPFELTDATVYRNGKPANVSALVANDVLYYHSSLKTIWAYSNQVVGMYTSASPNTVAPSSIVVAGNTYTLASSAAAYKLSAMGDYVPGDTVTLLLGMNGSVVDVLTPQESSAIQYGVVVSKGVETYLTNTSGSQVVNVITVACTDGSTRQYNSDAVVNAGDLVAVGIVNGNVHLTKLALKRISGTVNAAATELGDYTFAADVQILDTDSNGQSCTVRSTRLANTKLDSEDIRYFVLNSQREISHLILNDVTGDLHTYAVISDVTETTTAVSNGAGGSVDVTRYSFSYQNSSSKGVFSSLSYNLSGGVMLVYSNHTVSNILKLAELDIDTLSNSAVVGNHQEYQLAADLQVYLKTDEAIYTTNLAAVSDLNLYHLRGYYDSSIFVAGDRIRVIIATVK